MKIKIKEIVPGFTPISIIAKGDWIDIKTPTTVTLRAPQAGVQYTSENNKYRDVIFNHVMIPLGFALKLPKGYEAVILPRSSSFAKYGFLMTNSMGVIDNTYCGNNDEWKLSVVATRHATIPAGERIAQFKIQLSQYATWWQKLKWLFSSKIEFEYVDDLESTDRGGFGSTDK